MRRTISFKNIEVGIILKLNNDTIRKLKKEGEQIVAKTAASSWARLNFKFSLLVETVVSVIKALLLLVSCIETSQEYL